MPLGVNLSGTVLYGNDPVTKCIFFSFFSFSFSFLSISLFYVIYSFHFHYFSVNLIISIITFLNVKR